MHYFVTGASGFIGKRLVRKILRRKGATVYFLAFDVSPAALKSLYRFWGVDDKRAIAVAGDLTKPGLGVSKAEQKKLAGLPVRHFFHLAAIYDLKASAEQQAAVNVDGTRNVVEFAKEIGAGCFHHVSSIAAAGLYEGVFREDMFDEAENLDHPYFFDQARVREHRAQGMQACPGASTGRRWWSAIRPPAKWTRSTGPYYFFKLIQRMRQALPPWMPVIGIEGGRINIVPVDFVVSALDHIAHARGQDGKCFHLVDPQPLRVGDVLNAIAKAAHAPTMSLFVNAALLGFIPKGVKKGLMSARAGAPHPRRGDEGPRPARGHPDLRQLPDALRLPRGASGRSKAAASPCPRLETYAWRLWDYWERHLDPDLQIDRTLKGKVRGKVVLITGGSSGIGLAAAKKIARPAPRC